MVQKRKNTSISIRESKRQFLGSVLAITLGIVIVTGSIAIAKQVIPNDLCGEFWQMQWHLHNTGQSGGTPDADINAPEAWDITTGDPNIVIAILDTGVDLNHPDLANNLIPGYDFLDDDDSPAPIPGSHQHAAHGTACAGIAAAQGDNGIGVVGVTWNCKIMPIRIGLTSSTTADVGAKAFRWAASHGAHVLSCSIDAIGDLSIVDSAIMDVTKPGGIGRNGKGCVVVAAAGNGNRSPIFPASHPAVIAVGATDDHDRRLSFSNYGPELDIVAPTGDGSSLWVMTTDMTGIPGYMTTDYTYFSHTSGACPVVAGVAALILSVEPGLTSKEVRHFLTRSAKDLGDPGRDDYYGWGRVDAQAALDMVLAKRADLNNNWKVDFEDLLILIEFWGTAESSADIAPATKRDGIVNEQDLEFLIRYWQTEIPELGLIAHWKLDETEGDIAYESVQEISGNLYGEPRWQPTNGQVAGAIELDGIDDYVNTPFVFNPADGEFSVFVWIKGGTPGRSIVSQENGVSWLMADTSNGVLRTNLRTPATTGRNAVPAGPPLICSTVVTDGDWHRVGFVRDDSERALYVDDIEVARDTAETLESSEGGLYIGVASSLEPDSFFSGLIDDIRIYNRAVNP